MSHAIGIRLKRADAPYPPTASRFFGSPKIPLEWMVCELYENDLFFCQLRLADLAPHDPDGILPHTGYLYVFLQMHGNATPTARVMYFAGKPDYLGLDFNEDVEGYEHLTEPWAMEFEEVDADSPCTRLLGRPTVWQGACEPPPLLLQFDPSETRTGFLSGLDGYLCLFFDPEDASWDRIRARIIPKGSAEHPKNTKP